MNNELERKALLNFFEIISEMKGLDNNISDFKIIKDTQAKLRTALRNVTHRCKCAKCVYTICEVCQCSDRELVSLRNFFRMIRNAKKNNASPNDLKNFIENTKKDVA